MTEDIEAIRQLIAVAEQLQNDVAGFPDLFTEDGVVVNYGGRRVRGRETLREAMAAALNSPLAHIATKHEVRDVTLLRPDLALADVIKHVSDGRPEEVKQATGAFDGRGQMSFVLLKEEGTWRIALAHTTPIRA